MKNHTILARGYDQEDAKLFSAKEAEKLKQCLTDAVYLVNRGYPADSAIRFTAGHYRCPARQILMLSRAICSDRSLSLKREKEVQANDMVGRTLYIDGFNLIISLEIMFSGGTLFIARDGCIRDIAGLRGSYHLIEETNSAINLLARSVNQLGIAKVIIYLDSPISNSGRLRERILEMKDLFECPLEIEIIHNPDQQLYDKSVVGTADGIILENCNSWFNMASYCLKTIRKQASVDFSDI